jgi:hypothetical protein
MEMRMNVRASLLATELRTSQIDRHNILLLAQSIERYCISYLFCKDASSDGVDGARHSQTLERLFT